MHIPWFIPDWPQYLSKSPLLVGNSVGQIILVVKNWKGNRCEIFNKSFKVLYERSLPNYGKRWEENRLGSWKLYRNAHRYVFEGKCSLSIWYWQEYYLLCCWIYCTECKKSIKCKDCDNVLGNNAEIRMVLHGIATEDCQYLQAILFLLFLLCCMGSMWGSWEVIKLNLIF